MAKDLRELTREQVYAEEDALIDFQFALIDAMRERGMSKAELAEVLGVSRARVSQLFAPDANPTLKLAARALLAVGLKNEYCQRAKAEAVNTHLHDDVEEHLLAGVSTDTSFSWLGEFITTSNMERVDDTMKWIACQHRREESTGWHRKTGRVANSNGRKAMEAA